MREITVGEKQLVAVLTGLNIERILYSVKPLKTASQTVTEPSHLEEGSLRRPRIPSGRGKGEVGGTILFVPNEVQRENYAIMQARISRQQEDKSKIQAMKEAYEASDKTPTLRKRNPSS